MDGGFSLKVADGDMGVLPTSIGPVKMSQMDKDHNRIITTEEEDVFDSWIRALKQAARPYEIIRRGQP
jgi:hypothetical protein